ncbi:unnamed protein product [Phaedon cochleariae]|uniref:Uncharacterized protein n=1 Tax=Phaedon cochleariae TaxID=80249 RepID=A0A9P0DLQ3_PHACE|nr:unnamed protein product [Phaedon cochleariae]
MDDNYIIEKITLALCCVALANAGYLGGGLDEGYGGGYEGGYGGGYEGVALQGGYGGHDGGHEEINEHPKYKFNYAVHDPHTGDEKQQYEERDGDEVKGSYSLKEADGTTRVVEYKADKHNGFNAVVHKIGEPKQQIESYGGEYGGHHY